MKRRSGCRSSFSDGLLAVRERASRALSMPVALRVGLAVVVEVEGDGESSWERSRPRDFLTADLAFAFLGDERSDFSSSARRASFSAFLRACSCFFCSASSLDFDLKVQQGGLELMIGGDGGKDFLAFDLAPLLHSTSSAIAFLAFSAAAFWLAASAF